MATKATEKRLAFFFGASFLAILLVIAIGFPDPKPFQYTVFRITLAIAAGAAASLIPGFLEAQVAGSIRAGGALAVFVVVYFFSPAQLVSEPPAAQGISIGSVTTGDTPSGRNATITYEVRAPAPDATVQLEVASNREFNGPTLLVESLDPAGNRFTFKVPPQGKFVRLAVLRGGEAQTYSNVFSLDQGASG